MGARCCSGKHYSDSVTNVTGAVLMLPIAKEEVKLVSDLDATVKK